MDTKSVIQRVETQRCEHCKGEGECRCWACGKWNNEPKASGGFFPHRMIGVCKFCSGKGYCFCNSLG
ncbi:MAG: hypothetical protein WCO84_04970 [bacterium]